MAIRTRRDGFAAAPSHDRLLRIHHLRCHPLRHDQRRGVLYTVPSPGRLPAQGPHLLCRTTPVLSRRAALLSAQPGGGGSRLPSPGGSLVRKPRPSGIGSSAKSCFRARSSGAPGRGSTNGWSRARPAGSMSAYCISRRRRLARLSSPSISRRCWAMAGCPISRGPRRGRARADPLADSHGDAPDPAAYDRLLRQPAIVAAQVPP